MSRTLAEGWTVAALLAAVSFPILAQTADLPEGEGKAAVEGLCGSCHGVNRITRSAGYSRDDWHALTATMIDVSSHPRRGAMLDYLARHFQPGRGHAATPVPGPLTVTFREWVVPTLGQRSRDPVEAPDGSIWWAGQWGNLIGRIDPVSGAMREYPLPPNAMPHSVNADATGGIWYMGNKNGTIGRLDPASGDIRVYPMPDPAARDPHTAVFDASGVMWFTMQHSNMAGRLDPESGKVDLIDIPVAGSRPYGIELDPKGRPWIACNGSNCLVEVDPATLTATAHLLPDARTTVRRLDFDAAGTVWYVNSALGRLGRYDPATAAVKEWPSPSGPKSHPYAIAVVNGIVWYNESGVRPDMLVRFDPATETFQSWPIPSSQVYAGIIRHMRANRAGNLLIHQSSTNRIIEAALP